ncbi:hypothetical protein [Flavobacterium sp. N3904]|uniref:hypothetical protein n=1 Tax=Flavobacterium sp. N3904 TaxID=2986835 RepID=UPI0022259BD5|nr:hypothetical protein [Flavobacterium sp. N3904]
MDRLKQTILLVALLLSGTHSVFSQKSNSNKDASTILDSNPESLYLHCNATTFVTGETLYYKVYCLNPLDKKVSSVSKIAYVELIGEDNTSIFIQKLFLQKGISQGDFFVPTTLKTGKYRLIAYTNWILNKPLKDIFQQDIYIINPFQASEKVSTNTNIDSVNLKSINTATNFNTTIENTTDKDPVVLQLNKKIASTREKITLNINPLSQQISEKGNYSLSIRKIDSLPTKKQITAKEVKSNWEANTANQQSKGELILPELRGEIIAGSIVSKSGANDIQNKSIALSIPGKNYTFKIVNTNSSGKFIFNLDKVNYASNIIVQVIGEDRENYTIKIDSPSKIDYSLLKFDPNFNLTVEMKNNILQRSVASQIENAYYSNKTDSIVKTNLSDSFFNSVGREYVLEDYSFFPTLQETITEVLFEIYYKQKGNDYTIGVRDYITKLEVPGTTLVLVDGLFIQDFNELFAYKTKNIYKVSVVQGGYYYGPKLFNGVISFTTKNQDYVSKKSGSYIVNASVLRPAIKKEYFTPDYTDKAKLERIPDYRYQLLWLPDVALDNKENPISFYTSDVTGTFEISLEGFTDQGIPVSLKDTFEVQ